MFQQQAKQELFKTVKAFHVCKQEEGESFSTYVLKMKAYLDQMDRLGYPMPLVLRANLILTSLSKDYDQFVQNYNMHDMGKTIPELHAMLKIAEKSIPKKTPAVLAIRQGQIQKPKPQAQGKGNKRGKGKSKSKSNLAYDPKHKIPSPAKKEHRAKDAKFHHSVEAIGSFDLTLPSGMILVLDNCHFAPSITKRVISLSRLWDNAFLHKFMDNGAISVYKDNLFYFNAILRDGIFGIDMHDHGEKGERKEGGQKTTLPKLQHDGLLESTDDESFDVCVSCISGKMARKPFTHAIERADDLLGLIHNFPKRSRKSTRKDYKSASIELRRRVFKSRVFRSSEDLTTLPMSFWGYALESAARILNMVPTKKVNKTPYEIWHRKISNLSYLRSGVVRPSLNETWQIN
ncbi:hypothetical protein Tco_0464766 [Tanacetum coccineum]